MTLEKKCAQDNPPHVIHCKKENCIVKYYGHNFLRVCLLDNNNDLCQQMARSHVWTIHRGGGGFGTHIAVKFTHDQGYVRVSTCAQEVYLPLHYWTLSRFTGMMVEAIISSPGFGQTCDVLVCQLLCMYHFSYNFSQNYIILYDYMSNYIYN